MILDKSQNNFLSYKKKIINQTVMATLLECVGCKKISWEFIHFLKSIYGVIWAVKLEEMGSTVSCYSLQPIY